MENVNNIEDSNKKLNPKPTDDPGAEIETVTPDSHKESVQNDQCIPEKDSKDESIADVDIKGDVIPEPEVNNDSESGHAEHETFSPNAENEDLSDDMKNASKENIGNQMTDGNQDDMPSENSELSKNKNDEDSLGIETVTPS